MLVTIKENRHALKQFSLTAFYMKPTLSSDMDAAIRDARARGLTIIDTIKMIRERYQMSLGEAKQLVSNHRSWQDIVQASQPLKDEIEKLMSK